MRVYQGPLPVDAQKKTQTSWSSSKEGCSYLASEGIEGEGAESECELSWEGAKVEEVGAVRLAMRQVAIGRTIHGGVIR